MSASSVQNDQVYCHECGETWARRRHGLECPSCHSDVVEIIEASNDPRTMHEDPLPDIPNDFDAPDPDEDDISAFNFNPHGPQMESNTHTNRAGSPRTSPRPGNPNLQDPINSLFEGIMGVMGPMFQGQHTMPNRPGGFTTTYTSSPNTGRGVHFVMTSSSSSTPRTQSPFTQRAFRNMANNRPGIPSPFQHTPMSPDEMGIFSHMFQGMPGQPRQPTGTGAGTAGPHDHMQDLFGMIFRMINPGNAASGDYVNSAEEFNRILQEMMEHNTTSTAPGPASESAIDALPKRAIVKSDFGDNNTTLDCSICMDNVELGQEVTELPCKHWFHRDCVKAWLKEHDTCPQCRRGIMSREGNSDRPRNTGEMPRHWQSNGPRSPGPQSPSLTRNPTSTSRTPSFTQMPASTSQGPSFTQMPALTSTRPSFTQMPAPTSRRSTNQSPPAPPTPRSSTRSAQAANLSPRSSEPRPIRQTSYFSTPHSSSRVVPQTEPSRSSRPSPAPPARQQSSSSSRSSTSQLRSAGQGLMGWVGRHLGNNDGNNDSGGQSGGNTRR